jgi:hypothetical protein
VAAPSSSDARLRHLELGLALALLVALIAVRVSFVGHAGALWRDEVTSVNVASAPSTWAMLGLLDNDSFPAAWSLVLRSWIAVGLGRTDFSLRLLGLAMGLGIVGMLWWTGRRLHCDVPLISMVLFGLSPTVFVYGSQVRGYGLGVLSLLFLAGALWRVVEEPSRRAIATALAAGLLSAHSLYASSILLFCFALAGGIVALRNRDGRIAGILLGIGVVTAGSILPYVRTFTRIREWNVILQGELDLWWLFGKFSGAVGGTRMLVIWVVLLALSIGACVWRLVRDDPSRPPREKDLALFLVLGTAGSLLGYIAYLKGLRVGTQSWYYLPPMVILAVFFDAAIHRAVRQSILGRVLRLGFVVGLGATIAGSAWRETHVRMTNIDRVAAEIESRCSPGDLVVLNPWYAGVTLQRYYRGTAPWVSVPDFDERRFQPFRAFKEKMTEREPIKPVLDRITRTLRAGNRVWLAGGLPFLRNGERLEAIAPAPDGPAGWAMGPYHYVWLRQAAYLIQSRATRLESVPVPVEGPVNGFENLPLYVSEGWRDTQSTPP